MEKLHTDIHLATKKTPIPKGNLLSGDWYIDDGLITWGRHNLALAIQDRGMDVSFSRGIDAYDLEGGEAKVLNPIVRKTEGGYEVVVKPAVMAIDAIGAIRNIAKVLNNGLPELNSPAVRAITGDKVASNRLFRTVGIAKSSAAIDRDTGIVSALEHMPSGSLVLKPRYGRLSKGVHFGSKEQLAALFTDSKVDTSSEWIVEERLDFNEPISVQATDRSAQQHIDKANALGSPKELRIYAFGREESDQLITSSVIRLAKEGSPTLKDADRYLVEAGSVPVELYELTDSIVKELQIATGVTEIHIAVDWVLNTAKDGSISWVPMEINGGEPALMEDSEDPQAAKDHANKLADQLYRVALGGNNGSI